MPKSTFPLVSRWTSLKNAARLVKNPVPVVRETMKEIGSTYFFHMGGKTKGLITQDLEVIQHIIQKNHKNYQKSPLQSDVLASYIGKGLLTNNGDSWLRQRRLIQPAFSRKNINALETIVADEVDRLIIKEIGNGGRINITEFSALLTFHIVARAIFSDEVSHEQIIEMRDHVERVQQMIILQVRQPLKKLYFTLSGKITFHKKLAYNARMVGQDIAARRRTSGIRKQDILQFLLDTRYEDTNQPMDLDQLAEELIILVVAGHETTAHALTWTLFLLNQHLEDYRKVQEEISKLGNNYMAYFNNDSYLMAVIKESMRLYPPAWVIDRSGIADDVIQDQKIPKNTIIMSFIFGLHRNPEYWERAEEFMPQRFIDKPKPEAYFPFGAGPRLCIGNHFAYLELIISLVELLNRYDLPEEAIPHPGLRPLITLQPAKDIWLNLKKK